MLSRLVLSDFRNHAALTLRPRPGFVVLTGDNGAGKTNILEAVSLLAPGKGLRRANLGEMARSGGPGGFGVAATVRAEDGADVEIATGALAAAPERRVVRVNGAPATATTLASSACCLALRTVCGTPSFFSFWERYSDFSTETVPTSVGCPFS